MESQTPLADELQFMFQAVQLEPEVRQRLNIICTKIADMELSMAESLLAAEMTSKLLSDSTASSDDEVSAGPTANFFEESHVELDEPWFDSQVDGSEEPIYPDEFLDQDISAVMDFPVEDPIDSELESKETELAEETTVAEETEVAEKPKESPPIEETTAAAVSSRGGSTGSNSQAKLAIATILPPTPASISDIRTEHELEFKVLKWMGRKDWETAKSIAFGNILTNQVTVDCLELLSRMGFVERRAPTGLPVEWRITPAGRERLVEIGN